MRFELLRITVLGWGVATILVATITASDNVTPLKSHRILYNIDGCTSLYLKKGGYAAGPITERDLNAVIDEIHAPGSPVNTVLICVNGGTSLYYPSRVGTMIGSLDAADVRRTWPAEKQQWIANLEGFYSRNIDPYSVMFRHAKQLGLESLLSYRMNDAHGDPFLQGKIWREHPEWRLGAGLNFAYPEVREHVFRVIEEATCRYDGDGLELDFNRFPNYFPKPAEAADVAKIDDLVHRVRQMLDGEGKRRGRRLTLAVRVPSSWDECRKIGLSPATWAKNRWIDFLTASEFLFSKRFSLKPWKGRHSEHTDLRKHRMRGRPGVRAVLDAGAISCDGAILLERRRGWHLSFQFLHDARVGKKRVLSRRSKFFKTLNSWRVNVHTGIVNLESH